MEKYNKQNPLRFTLLRKCGTASVTFGVMVEAGKRFVCCTGEKGNPNAFKFNNHSFAALPDGEYCLKAIWNVNHFDFHIYNKNGVNPTYALITDRADPQEVRPGHICVGKFDFADADNIREMTHGEEALQALSAFLERLRNKGAIDFFPRPSSVRLTIKTAPDFRRLAVWHAEEDSPDLSEGEFNFLGQSLTDTDFLE